MTSISTILGTAPFKTRQERQSPTRILFALPAKDMGGSERVMLNLIRHINREQFEPHLTVLEPGVLPIEDLLGSVTIHDLVIRRARWAILPIAKLCWKLRPAIVLSMSAHLNAVVVASRPLLPAGTVLVVRETADLTSAERNPGRIKSLVYGHAYRRADLVICQSEYMKRDLVQHFAVAPSKVLRIYNPVDIQRIAALAEAEPNPFPNPGPNLVAVGRLCRTKGFDILLHALQRILVIIPNVCLTVVGEGPDLTSLQAVQRRLGLEAVVRFVGLRRNPFPFLRHADLLVLPSRSEAMPNVVLEAIALGTPAVTTNCTGALYEVAGCTQLLRIARDTTAEALAEEAILVLTGQNAKAAAVEPQFEARFGVRAVIKQYEAALLQSLSAQVSPLLRTST